MARRTVAASLVLAATLAAAGPVGLLGTGPAASAAAAVPGGPAGVFDLSSVGWLSYRNQSSGQFHDTYLDRRSTYLPLDLDIDTEDDYEVGSVWQLNRDERSWLVKRNLTSAAYKAYWEDARDDGYRPTEIETYRDDGRKWAGLWVENVEDYAWASHRGQTGAEFDATVIEHRDEGLMPVDFDEYLVDGKRRYASVWVESTVRDWDLVRDRTAGQWSDLFGSLSGRYRVLAFESLELDNDQQRYGGIWVSNDNGRGWAARRDMSSKGFSNWWYRYRDLGYRLTGYNRYETDDGTRYSGVWRQNNERPSWPLKSDVDAMVSNQLAADDVPGVAVAIYHNGIPVYLRGFGDANVDDGIWMDSSHISSTASVSKAVAGVLTMRMVEQNLIELGDLTEDWVPAMPNHHTHTVGQLLSNRGCVRHYDTGASDVDEDDYDTAREAAEEFWDDSLLCDPATEDEYHYSTHGYTLLGAALEAAGDDDVKGLVRSQLSNAFDLGTLRPQTESGHRMALYDDGDEEDQPNNDWKVLGGGIDSSTDDLARFGARLASGQILSSTSFTTMWTPPTPVSNYALGWNTGMVDGVQVVAKDGKQVGVRSYLRIYPTRDISVAVIMNDGSGGAVGLGQSIGDFVLDNTGP